MFFEMINKFDRFSGRLTERKMRSKKTQILKIRNERGCITTNLTERKGFIKECNANKLDCLDETNCYREK
jgi:hypothetical protein